MNELFVGVSILYKPNLNTRLESRLHSEDNIQDTSSSGYNTGISFWYFLLLFFFGKYLAYGINSILDRSFLLRIRSI